jgi:hypothetical protein
VVTGLKPSIRRRSAAWTILLDWTFGIVDDTGRIVREAKLASEPEALLAAVLSILLGLIL